MPKARARWRAIPDAAYSQLAIGPAPEATRTSSGPSDRVIQRCSARARDLVLVGACVGALLGCNPPVIPHAPELDSAVDAYRTDTGPEIVHDTGVDAVSVPMDAFTDAPIPDVGIPDSGVVPAIRVDGVFDDPFWVGVGLTPSTIAVLAPYEGDALTAVHYGRDANYLYVGFEGTLVAGDAVVMYFDTHFGDGVALNGGLGDNHGNVNNVLSLQLTATAEFQPEWGWGTSMMPRSIAVSDVSLGWRRLAMPPGTFTTVTADEQSACSMTGCETAILLTRLGVPPGGGITFIARLGRPGVGFSNQTFPTGDASSPELVGDIPLTVPLAL